MAISIDHLTRIIFIPQADLSLISGTKFQLDVNVFRLALKDLEDDSNGIQLLDTHVHNTEVVISGVTYARTFEVINGFTVEFEDGQYTAILVGANHNIADVVVENQVSVVTQNSAGLIGTPLTASEKSTLLADVAAITVDMDTIKKYEEGRWRIDDDANTMTFFDSDGTTPLQVFDLKDKDGVAASENVFERVPQ